MNTPDLNAVFTRVPLLRESKPEDFTITELVGYTNHTLRLQKGDADWVLRIPKTKMDAYIDRAAETHNQQQAADLGLAPGLAWRDDSGLSLMQMIPGRTLQADDLDRPACLETVAATLSRLHRSDLRFEGRVNLAELIHRYYRLLPEDRQQELSPRLQKAAEQLGWLEDRELPAVASHNDPTLENWLLDGDRLWLLDWEFSAMASPYWDLAILSNTAQLSSTRAADLLKAYCAGEAQMKESVFAVYRELLQLLSDCWMLALVPETE